MSRVRASWLAAQLSWRESAPSVPRRELAGVAARFDPGLDLQGVQGGFHGVLAALGGQVQNIRQSLAPRIAIRPVCHAFGDRIEESHRAVLIGADHRIADGTEGDLSALLLLVEFGFDRGGPADHVGSDQAAHQQGEQPEHEHQAERVLEGALGLVLCDPGSLLLEFEHQGQLRHDLVLHRHDLAIEQTLRRFQPAFVQQEQDGVLRAFPLPCQQHGVVQINPLRAAQSARHEAGSGLDEQARVLAETLPEFVPVEGIGGMHHVIQDHGPLARGMAHFPDQRHLGVVRPDDRFQVFVHDAHAAQARHHERHHQPQHQGETGKAQISCRSHAAASPNLFHQYC
ncbi:MAG: hypothetical protein ABS92_13530 [Thiobacillus sp. SCN 63-374]|nr:MAG: hypothetical protein ABS92_13530 [Thiobacillus sp. SCN 63-374]